MPISKESIPLRKECFENLQNREYLAKTTSCGRRGQGEDLIFMN
jgi:hypothetical protein